MAKHNPFKLTAVASALLATGALTPAYAVQYNNGDFNVQLDTTISIGSSWRLRNTDYAQVGTVNALAAQASGENPSGKMHLHGASIGDDSDLLWRRNSSFSELGKITMDLKMDYRDYGAFVRGKAFYDNRIVQGDGVTHLPAYYWKDAEGRNELPKQSDGRSADILDAFVWGNW
ncbi:MAG TPA: DUF1302 family protein, partial [Pseudomonadales bacterium]|nr:DUF1302 family protein [Pseudomonadales bacterium]